MIKIHAFIVVFGINACCVIPSLAAEVPLDVKTGLWELKLTGNSKGEMPMPTDKLDQLPPEQRAMLEQQIEKMKTLFNQNRTYKECLTEKDLKGGFRTDDEDKLCKKTVHTSTSTVLEEELTCSGQHISSSTIRFEAINRENVNGNIHAVINVADHKMTVDNTIEAKWLSADCGNIKPGSAEDE